jgi:molybdenum cofactor sulfurtransferase
MERFSADMISNLYGNPHSANSSSQLSSNRVDNVRQSVLRFFKANAEEFDVVFVANATAGIKLVMDAFNGHSDGFVYGYHQSSHTSVVGVRQCALKSHCYDDQEVEDWLCGKEPFVTQAHDGSLGLFAYPAQSNMDGRRLPLRWTARIREKRQKGGQKIYTLLDAAALVSTSPLDLSNASTAPDFTVLSFYKIFGFPDLGALIVRKESGHILRQRHYFGGGTVDMVLAIKEQWHASKEQMLHESLEDGSLAVHSIAALGIAIKVHEELYGTMERISKHTAALADLLYNGLKKLRHSNEAPVCELYTRGSAPYRNNQMQGPVVAFNLRNSFGAWVSNVEFERLAGVKNFHIRTGGVCNPGGIASALGLEPWEMKRNFSAGFRCGHENDIMGGKPTGVIRASLGAMNNAADVNKFVAFVQEFYVETSLPLSVTSSHPPLSTASQSMVVDNLFVYPIKSCGGMQIPAGIDWEVKKEGLAWDREWCLVHQGTGQALSQKRYPRMALIRPVIDLEAGLLRIRLHNPGSTKSQDEITVALSADPSFYEASRPQSMSSRVCGDEITAQRYSSPAISAFFSRALDIPCTLARFPAGGTGLSTRHSKAHMQTHQQPKRNMGWGELFSGILPGPPTPPDSDGESYIRPILLSNESPILLINKSSLNALNVEIAKTIGKVATPSVFRANIVVASQQDGTEEPYAEDHWSSLRIGHQDFQMLGSCRRCHMICIDQETAQKDEEPFVTLAKTRKFVGKVFFGSHMCHVPAAIPTREQQNPTIRIGDIVSIGLEK